jgi:glycosyltransferase involved in cell wall biosynthesis
LAILLASRTLKHCPVFFSFFADKISSSMTPVYSIVIPAFNEEVCLPATLASVRAAMSVVAEAGEIVVVDNNSSDRTAAVAEAGGARVVFEPVNQISRARNAGARAANAPWLIFLDADTLLPAGLLVRALDNLRGGHIAGGGALLEVDRPLPPRAQAVLDLWSWASRTLQWAAGSFIYCTREGFDAIGGFSLNVYASEEIIFSRAYTRWARRQGRAFHIIAEPPVITSSRKLQWYSTWQLAGTFLLMTLFPFAIRSKRLCAFWYQRPAG